MARSLPIAVLVAVALAPLAASLQAPPPIVRRPRAPPPPAAPAQRPQDAVRPVPARIAPDAIARWLAVGAAPTVLVARQAEGRPQRSASLTLRPLEVAGVAAVEVRFVVEREGAAATARDERLGVYRVVPFLEPVQLERRAGVAAAGREPELTSEVLRFDGQRFVDPAGSDTSQLVRSTLPLLTDTSVIPFAIALEKHAGATAVVDYLVSAPRPMLVSGATLTVRAAGRGPDGRVQWLVTVEAPAAPGAEPRALLRIVLDDEHRVRALELVPEALVLELAGRDAAAR